MSNGEELKEAEREQEERWRKQDEILERIERRRREETGEPEFDREEMLGNIVRKGSGKVHAYNPEEEQEEAEKERQGKEQERIFAEAALGGKTVEQIKKEEYIEDLHRLQSEQGSKYAEGEFTKAEDQERERQSRIGFYRGKAAEGAAKAEADKYTKTGQLKSALKDTARDFIKPTSAQRATKVITNIGTMGGKIKPEPTFLKKYYTGNLPSEFYTGKPIPVSPGRELHSTTGMKDLLVPKRPAGVGVASDLRHLNQPVATQRQGIDTPGLRQGMNLTRLREAGASFASSPLAQMARGSQSTQPEPSSGGRLTRPMTRGRVAIGNGNGNGTPLEPGEVNLGPFEDEVWFFKVGGADRGHWVIGQDVNVVKMATGAYRFSGVDEGDFTALSRTVGKYPPENRKYGPGKSPRPKGEFY